MFTTTTTTVLVPTEHPVDKLLHLRHTTYMEVDLTILEENVKAIRALCPNAKLLPMVKGDAYGHGMVPVTDFLHRGLGYTDFGVATLGEALVLSRRLPSLHTTYGASILVLSDSELHDPQLVRSYERTQPLAIIPVLQSLLDLTRYFELRDQGALNGVPLYIKLNTGMNRLGIAMDELNAVDEILRAHGASQIDQLLTHFGTANESASENPQINVQMEAFEMAKLHFALKGIHIAATSAANSGAIEQQIGINETWVRAGLMMYGPPSVLSPKKLWNGQCISRFVTKVLKVFEAKKGLPVGYGMNLPDRDCVMVILAVGYCDGFRKSYRGVTVYVDGIAGTVFGSVSMDTCFVRFDNLSLLSRFVPNSFVEIWSHDPSTILRLAKEAGTIPYEAFVLSPRVPRRYLHPTFAPLTHSSSMFTTANVLQPSL